MKLVTSGVILAASTVALVAETLNLAHFVPQQQMLPRSTIEPRYEGLSETHRAAIDGIAGRALSQSAEDGWQARADEVTQMLKDALKIRQ